MRLLRGVGALLGLLLGLVGVPLALLVLGGDVWPASWAPADLIAGLLRPDDGRLLIGLITIVGWIAWLVFALSVVAEVPGLVTRQRVQWHLPGLGGTQRLAAALLIAVVAMVPMTDAARAEPAPPTTTPEPSHASAPPVAVTPAPKATPSRSTPDPAAAAGTHRRAPGPAAQTHRRPPAAGEKPAVVHRVVQGDDLWSLAEHYYGDGTAWRKIAKANPHVLSGGPDRLLVGWRLAIPGVEPPERAERAERADHRESESRTTVTVRRGETLSSIAERELGSTSRWPTIYQANLAVLDDPDELAIGMELVVPRAHPKAAERSTNERTGSDATADRPALDEKPTDDQKSDHQKSGAQKSGAQKSGAQKPGHQKPGHQKPGHQKSGQQAPGHEKSADQGTNREPSADRPAAPRAAGAHASDPGAAQDATTSGPKTSHAPTTRPAPGVPVPGDPAAPTVTSEPAAPTAMAQSVPAAPSERPITDEASIAPMAAYAGVGGLLAAGVLGGLAYRRRLQLQARPVGRRILHPDAEAALAEVALGATQQPLDLATVDLVVRAVGAHCRRTGRPVPGLSLVELDADAVDLTLRTTGDEPPLGFVRRPGGWRVTPNEARYLSSIPDIDQAIRPYPTLVQLGTNGRRTVLANLEELGLLSLTGDSDRAAELLSALAVELAFAPWSDEMILTLVGDRAGLPDVLDKHNVTATDDVDALLGHLEARATAQRAQQPSGPAGHHRIDPDLSDPWAPEVVLIGSPLDREQERRFVALVTGEPRSTLAVVVVGPVPEAPWTLRLPESPGATALLEPVGLRLEVQTLRPAVEDAIVSLVAASGSTETTAAPWWADEGEPPGPPPDNVAYLARRAAGWATGIDPAPPHRTALTTTDGTAGIDGNGQDMADDELIGRDIPLDHPVLFMLGPIELLGAQGALPPRAAKQCLEYCGWLLEHPGTTAQAMGSALLVAEGTRRSNMSRLRSWLGADAEGLAYLPDAYSGRILLHPAVSSDWQRLQILTATGVNRTSESGLRSALELVRGAPLADAAPGQWHWAEELRTDMISAVRDIGVELAGRANEAGDLDLARWAAARALAAAPGDELLMATRIRTEHLAGNRAETERLTLQLATHARTLGVDLELETVELMQRVMEGQVRARMA